MFTVTQVGSWPRSNKLLDALTDLQHDKLTREEFERVADDEIRRAVELQIEAGVDVVTDGEQRRDNFFSFVTDKLDGAKLMTLADLAEHPHFERTLRRLGKLDVPPESIKNVTCVGKLKRREPLAVHELKFVKNLTDKPVKVPLPGPYLLARSMWVEGFSDETYPTHEELADDIVGILREELTELAAAGAEFVQFDEPVLSDVVFSTKPGETKFF